MQEKTTKNKQGLLSRYGEKAMRILTYPITKKMTFESGNKNPPKIDHAKEKQVRQAKEKMQERYKSRSGWDYVAY